MDLRFKGIGTGIYPQIQRQMDSEYRTPPPDTASSAIEIEGLNLGWLLCDGSRKRGSVVKGASVPTGKTTPNSPTSRKILGGSIKQDARGCNHSCEAAASPTGAQVPGVLGMRFTALSCSGMRKHNPSNTNVHVGARIRGTLVDVESEDTLPI